MSRVADRTDRTFIDNLRLVDGIRSEAAAAREAGAAASGVARVLRVAGWLAAIQTIYGLTILGTALASGVPIGLRGSQSALALAFAIASLLLTATASRDPRRLFLLSAFICTASTLARAALIGLSIGWPSITRHLFGGLSLEALVPAAMWAFAADFPRVHRFTSFDATSRRIANALLTLGLAVVVLNVGASYGLPLTQRFAILLPSSTKHLFWHGFTVCVMTALAAIAIRARRAPPGERAKVKRFVLALILGLTPFLILGLARAAVPGFNHWFLGLQPFARFWLDAIVIAGLISAPSLSIAAVIADRPFEVRPRAWWMPRRWLVTTTEAERLARAVEHVSRARGPREAADVLERELQASVRTVSVRVLVPAASGAFEDPADVLTPLPEDCAVLSLARAASDPIDVSPAHQLFNLLPPEDRDWIVLNGITLIAPVRRRDGTLAAIAALAPMRFVRTYTRHEASLVAALTAAAGLAWENEAIEAIVPSAHEDQPAYECGQCGVVQDSRRASCDCRAPIQLASLPYCLAGKFAIERRLGRGGMGVVYLARDLTIGRHVALKTLPALKRRASGQLRDEARAMAALNHEGLATIYGLETWRDTPVLVVEYFPLGTLAHRLASGPMPVAAAIDMALKLARALSCMHRQGVLHRDLKPSNIAFSEAGTPKLLDFGLAASVDASTADATTFDLWALATVLEDAIGGAQHPRLDAFIARALNPDPDRGFRTADEFESALDSVRRSADVSEF